MKRSLILFLLVLGVLTLSACGIISSEDKEDREKVTAEQIADDTGRAEEDTDAAEEDTDTAEEAETDTEEAIPEDTASEEDKARPEDELLGVWQYTTQPGSWYNKYTFSFSYVDGRYIGTYTDDMCFGGELGTVMAKHTVFEYSITDDGKLSLVIDGAMEKSEDFSLSNGILSYQGIDYAKVDYLKSFGAAPEEEEYELLINAKKTFVESGKYYDVYSLAYDSDSLYLGSAMRYAAVDMDGDGIKELLVEYSMAGDTAVIHWENGIWRAYYTSNRGIIGLKADGTMYGSSGAAAGCVHRYIFKDGQMQSVKLYEYDETDTPYYCADGFACDKEFMDQRAKEIAQDEKQDVVWTNFAA